MGREEALALADEVLGELRKLSYGECRQRMKAVSTRKLHGRDGADDQAEIEAFWDAGRKGDIRVVITGSGAGLSDSNPGVGTSLLLPTGRLSERVE